MIYVKNVIQLIPTDIIIESKRIKYLHYFEAWGYKTLAQLKSNMECFWMSFANPFVFVLFIYFYDKRPCVPKDLGCDGLSIFPAVWLPRRHCAIGGPL